MAKIRTDLMTAAEYLQHIAKQALKPSKYKNKWVRYEGQTFQSQAECEHYKFLLIQWQTGKIKEFTRQKLFKLVINGVQITTYRCDFFVTTLEGGYIVQDIKGFITEEYLIKKRLMKVIYQVDIQEPNLKTPAVKRSRNFRR